MRRVCVQVLVVRQAEFESYRCNPQTSKGAFILLEIKEAVITCSSSRIICWRRRPKLYFATHPRNMLCSHSLEQEKFRPPLRHHGIAGVDALQRIAELKVFSGRWGDGIRATFRPAVVQG